MRPCSFFVSGATVLAMIGMVFGQKSTSLGGAAKMGADPVVESVSSAAEMQDQRLVFKSRAHYVIGGN